MIEVKGIRATGKPAEADRYEVKGLAASSRIPALVAAMIGGIALYLRSFLPVTAGEPDPAPASRAPGATERDGDAPRDAPAAAASAGVDPDAAGGPRRSGLAEDALDPLPARVPMPRITGALEGMILPVRGNALFAERAAASNINLPPPMPGGSRPFIPGDQGDGLLFPGLGGLIDQPDLLDLTPPWILPGRARPDEEDDEETPGAARNRAPVNRGPVYLADVATSGILLIGLNDLLRHSSDADGDALAVTQILASSGTLQRTVEGFRYLPARDHIGPVTLTFLVSDGQATVRQTAILTVTETPIQGTEQDDILLGTPFADAIDGRGGDDNIVARQGNDLILGGSGDDHIVAGAGNDIVWGGAGNDMIFGGVGVDLLSGGDGADRLFGDAGNDTLFGDAGDDVLRGGDGDDILSGGSGDDQLFGDAGSDHLSGGTGADELQGGDGADRLFGEEGADTLDGGAGADYLAGGQGDDLLAGGAGDDTLDAGAGDDLLEGGDGADWLAGRAGNDRLVGGAGQDALYGGSGDDSLSGGEGDDFLDGGAGNDVIDDGAGADVVLAGLGDDIVLAHIDLSDDSYAGGEGYDTLDYSGAAQDLVIDMARSLVTGLDVGQDSISGFEGVVGGKGADRFVATTTSVAFTGGEGGDIFDFSAGVNQAAVFELAYQILDFGVGDRVRVDRYDFFKDLVEEITDDLEDYYEDRAERLAREDGRIRYRHDETDAFEKTLIDFDLDLDDTYEMTVMLNGHHLLMIVDQA